MAAQKYKIWATVVWMEPKTTSAQIGGYGS